MKWLVVAAVAAIVAMPYAANADNTGQGYGLGVHSCAEFAKSYAANPVVTEDLYFTWAQGFMSGLNLSLVSNTGSFRYIDGNDMASHKLRIRSFCATHPLAPYVGAVMDLLNSLPPRKAISN